MRVAAAAVAVVGWGALVLTPTGASAAMIDLIGDLNEEPLFRGSGTLLYFQTFLAPEQDTEFESLSFLIQLTSGGLVSGVDINAVLHEWDGALNTPIGETVFSGNDAVTSGDPPGPIGVWENVFFAEFSPVVTLIGGSPYILEFTGQGGWNGLIHTVPYADGYGGNIVVGGAFPDSSIFNLHVKMNFLRPVPLPATLPLFLSALAGLGLMGWRRKKAPAPVCRRY